jgi:hypothetical protein
MSNRLNLMLHAGASAVAREQVEECATPDATDTWHPIAHSKLVNMLVDRLPDYNMEVVQEAHGLYKDGSRYFGMFQVAGSDGASESGDDFGLVFGLRNSHDKTFPAGLCLGSGVFVCDNLSFSAEIVIGRRHTRHIMRDLPNLVTMAVGKLVQARIDQKRRLDIYKETEITDTQAHDLIIQGMRTKAINTTRVPKVVEQWHNPNHPEFAEGKNVWRLLNGFTEVYKETSLTELPNRTTRLHGILDAACGLTTSDSMKSDLRSAFGDQATVA